jgi:hypothetical protein
MKIVLQEGSSKILADDDEVLLEIEGGTTADAARIFAGVAGPMVKYFLLTEPDDPLKGLKADEIDAGDDELTEDEDDDEDEELK